MCVEGAGQIVEVKSQPVRLVRQGGTFDQARIFGELLDQPDLARVGQQAAAAVISARSNVCDAELLRAPAGTPNGSAHDAYCT